jgi:hypothetical protein
MIGIPPGEKYVLWCCSSVLIASEEQALISRVSEELSRDGRAVSARLVVRPHFQNLAKWKRWLAKEKRDIHLWPHPDDLQSFEVPVFHQDFFDALHYSKAVIGINTSAFLEAAVVDKPCLTILTEEFSDTQTALPHFQHLRTAGFLQCASDVPGLLREIDHVLDGHDPFAGRRRGFAQEFLRPNGRAIPASLVLADAIEKLGKLPCSPRTMA